MHAIQKNILPNYPTTVVQSTTLHGATPLNNVKLISKGETKISKKIANKFRVLIGRYLSLIVDYVKRYLRITINLTKADTPNI